MTRGRKRLSGLKQGVGFDLGLVLQTTQADHLKQGISLFSIFSKSGQYPFIWVKEHVGI